MAEIHNRMPVILNGYGEKAWLESHDEAEFLELLKPYPAQEMNAFRISELVNSPRNNSKEIIEPVELL